MGSHHVLFISNGHGEDLMGSRIARYLKKKNPNVAITALPIVGLGSAYQNEAIPLLLPGINLPSGGFVRNGFGNIIMDLRAGLWGLTVRQCAALQKVRQHVDLAVCVGDVYTLLLAGLFLRRPIVFLPTAKSDYIAPHWAIEISLMKHFCTIVFPRDSITADSLARHGVKARFVGNVMMDCLDYAGVDLVSPKSEWVIGILPGGRAEAYENMKDIAAAVLAFERLIETKGRKTIQYLVALSGGLTFTQLSAALEPLGWTSSSGGENEQTRGIIGYLHYGRSSSVVELTITQGRFADALRASNAVIGMAGTGNEQAVGLGKPVLTFIGRGPQFTPKFVKTQKKLLDGAIKVVDRDPGIVAGELLKMLTDKSLADSMGMIGRERMGQSGGAERITEEIITLLQR